MRLVALKEIKVIVFLVGLWQTYADEPEMCSVFVFIGVKSIHEFLKYPAQTKANKVTDKAGTCCPYSHTVQSHFYPMECSLMLFRGKSSVGLSNADFMLLHRCIKNIK